MVRLAVRVQQEDAGFELLLHGFSDLGVGFVLRVSDQEDLGREFVVGACWPCTEAAAGVSPEHRAVGIPQDFDDVDVDELIEVVGYHGWFVLVPACQLGCELPDCFHVGGVRVSSVPGLLTEVEDGGVLFGRTVGEVVGAAAQVLVGVECDCFLDEAEEYMYEAGVGVSQYDVEALVVQG